VDAAGSVGSRCVIQIEALAASDVRDKDDGGIGKWFLGFVENGGIDGAGIQADDNFQGTGGINSEWWIQGIDGSLSGGFHITLRRTRGRRDF